MADEPTDWIRIWAFCGPLVGIILGSCLSWFQQRYSMRHSDKIRFHQLRVEVYSKYLNTANNIMLDFLEGKRDNKNLENILYLGSQISLIASDNVRNHTVNINKTIAKISANLDNINQNKPNFEEHIRNFVEAARNDLGVLI